MSQALILAKTQDNDTIRSRLVQYLKYMSMSPLPPHISLHRTLATSHWQLLCPHTAIDLNVDIIRGTVVCHRVQPYLFKLLISAAAYLLASERQLCLSKGRNCYRTELRGPAELPYGTFARTSSVLYAGVKPAHARQKTYVLAHRW